MSLISPNFDVKLIIFPNFGQGPFPKIAGKGPVMNVAFHQGLHRLLRQSRSSKKDIHFFLIIACNPSMHVCIYNLDDPDISLSNLMEKSICLDKGLTFQTELSREARTCFFAWTFIFNFSLYVGTVKVQLVLYQLVAYIFVYARSTKISCARSILITCFENDECFIPRLVFDAYI